MKLTRLFPAVVAATMLAACSPLPSTAVSVDGNSYTESEVTTAMEACADALGFDVTRLDRRAVVQTLVLAGVFDRMGDVPQEQLDELTRTQIAGGAEMMSDEECAPLARGTMKVQFLQQLDQNAVLESLQAADVKLNPRYGTWEPSEQGLFGQSGSLSVPAIQQ